MTELTLLIALLAVGGVAVVLFMMRRQSQRIDELQEQVNRVAAQNVRPGKGAPTRRSGAENSARREAVADDDSDNTREEESPRVQALVDIVAGVPLDDRARRAFSALLDTARKVFKLAPGEGVDAEEQEQREWIENQCIPRLDGPVTTFVQMNAGDEGEASRRVAKWYEGLLDDLGVRTIPVKTGETRFDGLRHNAVLGFAESEYPEMTIIEELRRGYEFADSGRVIKKADVRVAGK